MEAAMSNTQPQDKGQDINPGDEAAPGTPGTGEDVCPSCKGTGRLASGQPCAVCGGSGKITEGIGGG
jgi:DnaJ-class molecular chaperone